MYKAELFEWNIFTTGQDGSGPSVGRRVAYLPRSMLAEKLAEPVVRRPVTVVSR